MRVIGVIEAGDNLYTRHVEVRELHEAGAETRADLKCKGATEGLRTTRPRPAGHGQ